MQLLSIGFGAFAIFGTLTTVLNSLGRERSSAVITAVAFALVVLLCFVLVRGGAFNAELLWRTAIATSMGLGVATLVAAALVRRAASAVVSPKSLVRMLVALGVAIGVGQLLPTPGKLATILYAAVLASVYVLALIVLGELGRADLADVKNVVARRGGPRASS
jgi:O-antigen/teichoic acid export membrane protein